MILCTKCGEGKEPTEFYRDSSRANGLDSWCKVCCNGRDQAHVQILREWKETQPCTDCEEFFPHYVLQFDHTQGRPSRVNGIFSQVCTLEGLLRIIEKECLEVVCANCHCVRTWARNQVAVA